MIDLLPTFAGMAGAGLPERKIDGFDMGRVWFGDRGEASPRDEVGFFYYHAEQLQAVRSGPWKLYLALENKVMNLADKMERAEARLFDVRNDVGEAREVSGEQPEVMERLNALAEAARAELGDLGREGTGQRAAGWVERPTGRVMGVR
jgi:arylsulfatase A-like enzyme